MIENLHFIGRTGRFVPVLASTGGGILYRIKDDKHYAVTGTKGYLWMEAEVAQQMGDEIEIDMVYFYKLADAAKKTIEKFGDFDEFIA